MKKLFEKFDITKSGYINYSDLSSVIEGGLTMNIE